MNVDVTESVEGLQGNVKVLQTNNVNKKSEFFIESFAPTIWQVMAPNNYSTKSMARAISIPSGGAEIIPYRNEKVAQGENHLNFETSHPYQVGYEAKTDGNSAIAIGPWAKALYQDAIAIGKTAYATGWSSVAIGSEFKDKGQDEKGMDDHTMATGDYSTALGSVSKSLGYVSTVVGHRSWASGAFGLAVGAFAKVKENYAVALGGSAEALVRGSVALGGNSVAKTAAGKTGYSPLHADPIEFADPIADDGFTWYSTLGAVSVGDIEKKIAPDYRSSSWY